jgi:hypothetical protein
MEDVLTSVGLSSNLLDFPTERELENGFTHKQKKAILSPDPSSAKYLMTSPRIGRIGSKRAHQLGGAVHSMDDVGSRNSQCADISEKGERDPS